MKRFFRRKHTIPANQQQVEQDLQNLDRAIHRDPQNSALHLQKSVALIKRGRFPEATQSVQTALRFDPRSLSTFIGKEENPANTQAFQIALNECDLNLRLPYKPILSTMDRWVISSHPDPQGAAERALHALAVALSYQPLSLEIYSRRGEIMAKLLHDFEQALQAYDLALALDPRNAQVNRDRAAVLYLLGRHQDALHQIESALRLRPDDPEALHTKGSTLYELDQYQQALECFDQAIRLEPSYLLAYLGKAFVLTAQSEPKQALAALDIALDLDPNLAVAYLMRGNLLLLSRPREAVQAYDRALNLGLHESAAEDCMLKKCAALAGAGDIPQALADLERVSVRFPRNTQCLMLKATLLHTLQRDREALTALERASALDPRDVSILLTRGELLQEMDQFQRALATFNEAINLQPNFADAYTRKGILLATYEQPREAVLTLAKALELDPRNLDALTAISTILNHFGQPRDALKFAETACEVSPERSEAHRQKGIALEGLQRSSEALQAYERALKCNPQDANLYHDKGVLLDKMGRPEEALQSLDQALALNPQLLFSYHSKAIILHSLKRYREALEACETALQLDPTFQQAQMRKARILSEMPYKSQQEGPSRLEPLPEEQSRGIPDRQEQPYFTTEESSMQDPSQTLKNFGREVPLDNIFAFYASLGLSRKLAHKSQSGAELLGAAWAAFSDGEIDLPLGGRPLDPDIAPIFGPQVPTEGWFYRSLQAERRKVEQDLAALSPAFETLQLHWGAHLATMLAMHPELLDHLGWYWRIQDRALAFAPERKQGGELTPSQSIPLSPLHLVIEIDPGVRGAFAVQRLYDGQWATPWRAHPFQYWAIHRNDFHAQFLSTYLDAYGNYLFDFWSQKQNQTDLVQGSLFFSTQLPEYLEYGKSLGDKKDFGRSIRQDSGFANLKGNPADEINKIVASHKERKANYELVDLVVWASRSVLHATEQELAATIRSAHTILRPGNGMLIGAPILQRPEDANLALQKVEAIARDIFGERNVQNYLVNNTKRPSSLLLSFVFLRKEASSRSQNISEMMTPRTSFTLALPQTIYQEMVTHVMNGYPHMTCGVLGSKDGRVIKHYPVTNAAPNPKEFFEVGAEDMLNITMNLMEYDGEPICYVSYPSATAYPSKSIIQSMRTHSWPFIIFSLKQYPERPSCRLFTVDSAGSVTEGKLELIS